MIACPACSRRCSDQAESCPGCGQPLRRGSVLTKNLGFGGVVYTLMIVLGMVLVSVFEHITVGVLLIITGGLLILARVATAR